MFAGHDRNAADCETAGAVEALRWESVNAAAVVRGGSYDLESADRLG
jgi:hypothetical protein